MENTQTRKAIVTKYGILKSVINDEYYESGQLKSVMVEEESVLDTPYGRLIPNYSDSEIRKKYRDAVTFFEDGSIESIYLENPQPINTSVGFIDAELVTFIQTEKSDDCSHCMGKSAAIGQRRMSMNMQKR
ncbi:MAG: hypothetical protein IJ815_08365 [Lachnospiraceae bacterium]|nr:hypothetical protein [Lachnospiraceae bacterium]